jgi:drug/metabolite transporter (DMT)-like permease
MFYLSAIIAITGVVGYQYFVKRVPVTLNPIVSVIAMYIVVLVLGAILLPFFPAEGGFRHHLRQVNWIQIALAVCVIMGQLGFLLMYRYGWSLSTGNLVTGVFVNIILVGLGVTLLGEKVSNINMVGFVLSIVGVAIISYRP